MFLQVLHQKEHYFYKFVQLCFIVLLFSGSAVANIRSVGEGLFPMVTWFLDDYFLERNCERWGHICWATTTSRSDIECEMWLLTTDVDTINFVLKTLALATSCLKFDHLSKWARLMCFEVWPSFKAEVLQHCVLATQQRHLEDLSRTLNQIVCDMCIY